jgi:hypothetical protein
MLLVPIPTGMGIHSLKPPTLSRLRLRPAFFAGKTAGWETLLHSPQAAKHPLQDTTSFRRYRAGG